MQHESMGSLGPINDYYLRRYRKARATADLWISILEACQHYTCSNRNLFYWTSEYQGAQKNSRVYDTTAVSALRTFVSKVHGSLTPPQQVWAILETGSEIPEDEKERVNNYLREATDIIFTAIRNSNFDLAANETYYDLGIGTGCMLCNEGPDEDPLRFYSVPLARVAFEDNVSGLLNSNYRWWDEIRIIDILAMWPKCTLTPMMTELYRTDPNAFVKQLIEGCIEVLDDKKYPFRYFVMHENELIYEEKLESSPWIVFRWTKINNEIYGRGPVIEALPTILTLNELARIEITAANMNVNKPIMAYSDGVFNPWTFKLEPNTIIPVSPNTNGQFPLQPFPDTTNPQFMQLTSNDLRQQINRMLYADPLGPIQDAPNKTATELAIRQRNLAEEIGPLFTRLQQEYLGKLLKRIIYILTRKGMLEPLIIDGKEIQIRYQSPLVIAQGQQDVQTFSQYYQVLSGVYGPEAAVTYLDPVKFPSWISSKLGVDPTILNGDDKMTQFFAEQSEKAQAMELLQLTGGQAENG